MTRGTLINTASNKDGNSSTASSAHQAKQKCKHVLHNILQRLLQLFSHSKSGCGVQEKYNCSGSANEFELGLTASHWLGAQWTWVCSTVSIFLKAQISRSTAIKSFRMNSDLWKALLMNHAPKPPSSFPGRKHLLAFLRFWYLRKYRWSESTLCTCGQRHVSACIPRPLYSRGSAEFARGLKRHQILEPLWKQPAGKNKFPTEGKMATPSWALKGSKESTWEQGTVTASVPCEKLRHLLCKHRCLENISAFPHGFFDA